MIKTEIERLVEKLLTQTDVRNRDILKAKIKEKLLRKLAQASKEKKPFYQNCLDLLATNNFEALLSNFQVKRVEKKAHHSNNSVALLLIILAAIALFFLLRGNLF